MAEATCEAIKSNVENWLNAKDNTIKMKFTADTSTSGLVEQDFPARAENGPTFAYNAISAQGRNIYFLISFGKKVCPTTIVQELRNSLDFVTLDDIPLPDFDYPPNWEISPRTPVSSFKAGVEIVSYQNGRLHYKIDTTFFCISGNLSGPWFTPGCCNPPAPPGSYFRVEKNIHGIIEVDLPLIFL